MPKRPHVKLNTKLQKEKPEKLSFNYGYGETQENKDPDYEPMVDSFRNSLQRFSIDRQTRRAERNAALEVPDHIDYIQIDFHGAFSLESYNQIYLNEFGLLAIRLSDFNRRVLFSVENQGQFASFLKDIENFVLKESGQNQQAEYRGKVKYIREFRLLTTSNILAYQEQVELMNFQLTEAPAGSAEWHEIYESLDKYLNERELKHRFIEEAFLLEVYGATTADIEEIAKNFDILHSVTSSLSTVVSPSEFNLVKKGYGFDIGNADDELPLIGILDTGVSRETPLGPIIIDDDSFNLTGSSPFVDTAEDGYGHGTAVAALAAMGRRPYSLDYKGVISADAKLLSMKIMDKSQGYLSMLDVLDLLRKAKANYPKIKIFVLTTCYAGSKSTNEAASPYAYELDKFAHENDCLLFICTANNERAANQPKYDLNYFSNEETNLCSPAESMNNITIGAAADNIKSTGFCGISQGAEWPALYSRKGHLDLEQYKKPGKRFTKNNAHLFKPDILASGGDYEQGKGFIGVGEKATMEVLSANPTRGFMKVVGTSFSTPLVANIAAQLQKQYPNLRAQSIKALILNSAGLNNFRINNADDKLKNATAGRGLADADKSLNSSDSAISFVIEETIEPKQMKVFPLNFPNYLTTQNLGKDNGILRVTATLCYSFDPEFNNQMAYCPVHMAFSIFRNHTTKEILASANPEKGGINSKLKKSWSQDNRWKLGPPASNAQKIEFVVNVKDLLDEGSTFKLAIHCKLSAQLISTIGYEKEHPFSIALTIEETLKKGKATGKLYQEMILVNEVENIVHIEGEAEGDIEL
jgi:hypothetical protein